VSARTASLLVALAGCVEGLPAGELGLARRIDVMPGEVVAVIPPITDLDGDVFVVTGYGDAVTPSPGAIYVGGARGGWTMACGTGSGPDAGARGWLGVDDRRAWLWTRAAIVGVDATGACTTILDRDPASGTDVTFEAVAPLVERSISGVRAIAVITTATGTSEQPYLVTIDLERGTFTDSIALPVGTRVLGGGGRHDLAAFALADATGGSLALASPAGGLLARVPLTGTPAMLASELVVGDDDSIAFLAGDRVWVGDRDGVRDVGPAAEARGVERDDDGALWLTGVGPTGPTIAPIVAGALGGAEPWTSAASLAAQLATGIAVLDERDGGRTGTRWIAHSALGDALFVASRPARPYAVGVRGWLVGDPPVERGGIAYNQIAFVPAGVSFP